jgi:hypothetical protein
MYPETAQVPADQPRVQREFLIMIASLVSHLGGSKNALRSRRGGVVGVQKRDVLASDYASGVGKPQLGGTGEVKRTEAPSKIRQNICLYCGMIILVVGMISVIFAAVSLDPW